MKIYLSSPKRQIQASKSDAGPTFPQFPSHSLNDPMWSNFSSVLSLSLFLVSVDDLFSALSLKSL